jgi:hypothetical protein
MVKIDSQPVMCASHAFLMNFLPLLPSSPSFLSYSISLSLSLSHLCNISIPLSSSCKISTGLQFQHFDSNRNVRKRKKLTGFEAAARNIAKCTGDTNTELEEKEAAADFDFVGTGQEESVALSNRQFEG